MKNKKILVTGAGGFIGSRLVERLTKLGNAPYLLIRKNNNRKRLNPFLNKVRLFEVDLVEYDNLRKIIEKVKPQIIFHLASHGVYTYANNDRDNIISMLDSNIRGTINLLEASRKINYQLFVNTGSCFEYGTKNSPFKEDSSLSPCNIYGATKAAAALFAQIFSKNFNLPIVTLRPFSVYGPGEDDRRFISTAIKQCLKKENPKLITEKIIRDYVFIDDVIDAYLLTYKHRKKLSGEIINISTGKTNSLFDVAKLIIRLTGVKGLRPEAGTLSKRTGEVLSLIGCPEKAKRLLNWEAQSSLEEGIKKTIAWLKSS